MKKCVKCNIEKELLDFGKAKLNKDGLKGTCKVCLELYNKEYQKIYSINNYENKKKYNKKYYIDNKEKLDNKQKKYSIDNKEKLKEYSNKYYTNNLEKLKEKNKKRYSREYINKYMKERRLIDSLFKLRCNIRGLISKSIKARGYDKNSKTFEYLGCTFEEFKIHLENKFTEGMNWENQGEWHLDHIYPVSLAKDEEHLIKLNHYSNFQPLWAIDNIKKGNRI
jgi:hypothetical protein